MNYGIIKQITAFINSIDFIGEDDITITLSDNDEGYISEEILDFRK